MHNINWYDKFEKEDVREVKEELVTWALLNPNAVLLFDIKTMYKLYNKAIDQKINPILLSGNRLEIDNIIIEWYQLEGSKCILKRLTSTSKRNLIYNEPATWEKTEIWKVTSNEQH